MARDPAKKSGGGSYTSTMTSAAVVCVAVAIVALGRIGLKSEESRLYSEISRQDYRVQEIRRSNRKLQIDYETLTSPAGLSARIRDMRLNLVMPGEDARVVLPEPVTDAPFPPAIAWRTDTGRGALAANPGRPSGSRRIP